MKRLLQLTLLLILLAAILIGSNQVASTLPVDDFVSYWSTGRLLLRGDNPYAPDQIFPLEKEAGREEDHVLLVWYPPWAFAFFIPFGALAYVPARFAWLLLNFAAIAIASPLLWRLYGGSRRGLPWAGLMTVLYFPTLLGLSIGQISPIFLLGIAGFLYGARRGRWWLAGASLLPLTFKPQLLSLFWLALLLWTFRRREWRVVAGLALGIGIASAAAFAANGSIFTAYVETLIHQPPLYRTPTVGTVLVLLTDASKGWLRFLPALLALPWLLWMWRRQGDGWAWESQMPDLAMASLLVAPFAWLWDTIIVLPAIFQWAIAAQKRDTAGAFVALFLLVNGALFAQYMSELGQEWFVWFVPFLLLCRRFVHSRTSRRPAADIEP